MPMNLETVDKKNIWHPFTPLEGGAEPLVVESASGVHLHLKDGRKIIDAVSDNDGRILQVNYAYEIAGVQYESAQALSDLQQQRPHDYAPGKQIVVRYDPRRPANSIVV